MRNAVSVRDLLRRRIPKRTILLAATPSSFRGTEHCSYCGEDINGEVLSFRIGSVVYRKFGALFIDDTFRDNSVVKWFHPSCVNAVAPETLRHDWCILCDAQFFAEESALRISSGVIKQERGHVEFVETHEGYAHFICVCEDWEVPLWDITSE